MFAHISTVMSYSGRRRRSPDAAKNRKDVWGRTHPVPEETSRSVSVPPPLFGELYSSRGVGLKKKKKTLQVWNPRWSFQSNKVSTYAQAKEAIIFNLRGLPKSLWLKQPITHIRCKNIVHNPVQCFYYVTYLMSVINLLYYPIVFVATRWVLLCFLLQVNFPHQRRQSLEPCNVSFSVAVSFGCWGINWSCIFAKKPIYLAPVMVWVCSAHFRN